MCSDFALWLRRVRSEVAYSGMLAVYDVWGRKGPSYVSLNSFCLVRNQSGTQTFS